MYLKVQAVQSERPGRVPHKQTKAPGYTLHGKMRYSIPKGSIMPIDIQRRAFKLESQSDGNVEYNLEFGDSC